MDCDYGQQVVSLTVSPYPDDPEVVRNDEPGLQAAPDTCQIPQTIVRSDSLPTYINGPHNIEAENIEHDSKAGYGQRQRDRVCRLTPRVFWALAIGTILLIGAAVGGGIASALSRAKMSSPSVASSPSDTTAISASLTTSVTTAATLIPPELATTATPTASESTSALGTKTAIYGPSGSVLYRDCQASEGTLYASPEAPLWQWRKYRDNTTFTSAKPGQQWVNTFATDLDTCVDLCV